MPRRTSRPSGGRRPAPRAAPARSASTRTTRAAPARPAPPPAKQGAPASNQPAQAQKQQNAPPPATAAAGQPSPMGGFMANVASTGLGVMAGRAMDRAFFGGSGSAAEAAEHDAAPTDSASYSSEYSLQPDEITPSICAREALEFKKCMEENASSIGACQWNLNILAACQQREQEQPGFADAGRF